MKAQVDSSSTGWEDFISREEKRKAAWGHAEGWGKWWSHGSGERLDIYSLYWMKVAMSLRCKQKFPGSEKCLHDQLSPCGTSCSLSFSLVEKVSIPLPFCRWSPSLSLNLAQYGGHLSQPSIFNKYRLKSFWKEMLLLLMIGGLHTFSWISSLIHV
jgi:hypothetical protein